jgi:Phospholipid-translocating ATPase N-terminal
MIHLFTLATAFIHHLFLSMRQSLTPPCAAAHRCCRVLHFGKGVHDKGSSEKTYCNNFIKTSKYSLINFLPKSIFEQFRRLGNQYFLLLVILMVRSGR